MSSPFYIGIAGPAHSGKDTVCGLIQEYLKDREGVVRFALADDLKEQCAKMLGIPIEQFYDPVYKEALRPLMQWYGTEYKKNPLFGGYDLYWCDRLGIRIFEDFEETPSVVIVPDIRWDYEADWIRDQQGGVVINIDPVGHTKLETNHSSENGLPEECFDYLVLNYHHQGGLHKLQEQIIYLMTKIEDRI